MPIAIQFAAYLAANGYHPRSSEHSNFQSELIVSDLIGHCPLIARRAATGEIVAKLRHKQMVAGNDWVIDIAIGTCAGSPTPPQSGALITFAQPVIIQIAIELKSILTEHKKARRNRLRDFTAFHGHGHTYDPRTIVAAFLVVNSADYFYSPLNLGKDLLPNPAKRPELNTHFTNSRTARQLAKESIDLFRTIHLRHSPSDQPGLEALGVSVVEHDNIGFYPDPTKYPTLQKPTQAAPTPPRLSPGNPLSYHSMIQRICFAYGQRFP
ncbi:MAG: hypothetical protein FJX44_11235 [Alphaproteobacteria bacterium]|nr:hypothetical protein [Alphaproteobacteria bacterium]